MYSFFGMFCDERPDVAEEVSRRWPGADVAEISQPFRGLAVRFPGGTYEPAAEHIPDRMILGVEEISRTWPDARFVLLRAECWGGDCAYWGSFIRRGRTLEQQAGQGALRRLIQHFGADLGPQESFEPLSRTFPWAAARSPS
jgi:hypothetical protein